MGILLWLVCSDFLDQGSQTQITWEPQATWSPAKGVGGQCPTLILKCNDFKYINIIP